MRRRSGVGRARVRRSSGPESTSGRERPRPEHLTLSRRRTATASGTLVRVPKAPRDCPCHSASATARAAVHSTRVGAKPRRRSPSCARASPRSRSGWSTICDRHRQHGPSGPRRSSCRSGARPADGRAPISRFDHPRGDRPRRARRRALSRPHLRGRYRPFLCGALAVLQGGRRLALPGWRHGRAVSERPPPFRPSRFICARWQCGPNVPVKTIRCRLSSYNSVGRRDYLGSLGSTVHRHLTAA